MQTQLITSTSNELIKSLVKQRQSLPKLSSLLAPAAPISNHNNNKNNFVSSSAPTTIVSNAKLIHELCTQHKLIPKRLFANEMSVEVSAEEQNNQNNKNFTRSAQEIISYLQLQTPSSSSPSSSPSTRVLFATDHVMKKLSGLETSTDLIAEFEIPRPINLLELQSLTTTPNNKKNKNKNKQQEALHLTVLHSLTDPGNLGTLLRSAYGFSYDAVHCSSTTVHPFNEKCIRASRGTSFYMPLSVAPPPIASQSSSSNSNSNGSDLKHLATVIKDRNMLCLLARQQQQEDGSNNKNLDVSIQDTKVLAKLLQQHSKGGFALVMGNEHHGLDLQEWQQAQVPNLYSVYIPMCNQLESLNVAVAGSILMYNLKEIAKS